MTPIHLKMSIEKSIKLVVCNLLNLHTLEPTDNSESVDSDQTFRHKRTLLTNHENSYEKR